MYDRKYYIVLRYCLNLNTFYNQNITSQYYYYIYQFITQGLQSLL